MKKFNTTAVCLSDKHYMVDITSRIDEIKKLVDAGKYFTINRARQYGKTTTLNALRNVLQNDYCVLNLSFEGLTKANFADEQIFVQSFCRLLTRNPKFFKTIPDSIQKKIIDYRDRKKYRVQLDEFFSTLTEWCMISEKPIVMFIDEVDKVKDNQIFIDFLGLLRNGYISRETEGLPAFHTVILAGVVDIKHMKGKLRPEDEQKENSPWNIAADFLIDMSLSEEGIKGMLDEYEADHHTGMNTGKMAKMLWDETSGYPFLVSRLCQLIDEQVCKKMEPSLAWSLVGYDEAIKLILSEGSTLFGSLTKNLKLYPKLKTAIRSILMEGTKLTYNSDQDDIVQLEMYGLIKNDHNTVVVANRLFERRLYNLFLSEEEMKNNVFYNRGELDKSKYIKNGKLNMKAALEGFIHAYTQTHGELKERFDEEHGRQDFLLYLKPIINGTGNFYVEAETRSQRRTDVIVDYLGEQFVIELKIWKGPKYNAEGEKQITDYLDELELDTGYMLTFNFNKKKVQGVKEVEMNGKKIIEAMV